MTPARTSVRAGGVLLFDAVVVVPGDHEDTGNGHTGDDEGDHVLILLLVKASPPCETRDFGVSLTRR